MANLYALRTRRAAQLAEAEKVAANASLEAWQPEATALVNALTASLANDDARIAAFESSLPTLESAARAELMARAALGNCQRAHGFGTIERKKALALRDNLEAAESSLKVCARELQQAKQTACSGLPTTSTIAEGPGRNVVESISNHCIAKKFHPDYASIDPEIRTRWLEAPDAEVMWWPLHAARVLASARQEWEDARREAVALPKADFVEEFAKLKAERAAHRQAKIRAAQSVVDAAKSSAAALNVGGAA